MLALRFSRHEITWTTGVVEQWSTVGREMGLSLQLGPPTDVQVRRWLAGLGRLHAGAVLRVCASRWHAMRNSGAPAPTAAAVRALHRRFRAQRFSPIELADLAVGGEDLQRAGIPAGPIYAKILHALLERVLHDPARNTTAVLLADLPRILSAIDGTGPSS